MPPLNTPEGEAWLWREIDAVRPDVILFDSIMCLLAGSMAEEESWAPVKLTMRKITGRGIAQFWWHHTGHDATKGFGTKTREWEMDTVASLTEEENGGGVAFDFRKARLRTPKTAEDFKSRVTIRDANGWSVTGDALAKPGGATTSEVAAVKIALLRAYDRLADTCPPRAVSMGQPNRGLCSAMGTLRGRCTQRACNG
jgi:hypothetical protein